jgi:hypothetical protein
MYPEPEIYTLQDMMEEDSTESPLDDALWQAFRQTDILVDVNEEKRNIELTIDADEILFASAIQTLTQQVSDVVEKVGGGKVMFVGIQGGVNMRIGLIYRY